MQEKSHTVVEIYKGHPAPTYRGQNQCSVGEGKVGLCTCHGDYEMNLTPPSQYANVLHRGL